MAAMAAFTFSSCEDVPEPYTMPTSATLRGTNSPATMVIMMGNRIFAVLLTCFSAYGMRIRRSFLVVTSRMTGGWMMGTSAM